MYKNLGLSIAVFVAIIIAFAASTNSQICSTPGCLDQTFGIGGINIINPPLSDDQSNNGAWDMVFQNDGKIVILARAQDTASTFRNVLIRYTADGQLDTSFAADGILYIPSTAPRGALVRRLVKQVVDGQEFFILAGGDICANGYCLRAERYTTTGAQDTSFGTGGSSFVPSGCGTITAVAVQSDQKILVGCPQYPLIRLNSNGTPDSSFGPNGISTTNDTRMLISAIRPMSDGKILTAGTYFSSASPDVYVARFASTGKWDASFGSQGKRVVDFAGQSDGARDIAIDSSGKILVSGYATFGNPPPASYSGWDAVLLRLTSKGVLDKTFGSNGKAAPLNVGGDQDFYRSIALQANGKIAVTGIGTLAGNGSDILVARYNTNGTLDQTFNGDGWNLTDIYGSGDSGATGLIQSDPSCSCNKLVVAGTAETGVYPSPQSIVAVRFIL